MKKLLCIALILAGIFLRVYKFDTLPGGFFIDEINIGVDAKSLVENGTDQYGIPHPFVFEDATDYKLPGYIYAAAASYKIFGPTLTSVRFPSLISSILSIFLLGYFVSLLFPNKKNLPWLSMIALSLSPFAIHFARIGYETTFSTFFILLYITALYKILITRNLDSHFRGNDKGKLVWSAIAVLSLLIATFTYPAPRFILPVFTLVLLISCWVMKYKDVDVAHARKILILFFIGNIATFISPLLFTKADQRPLSYLQGDPNLSGLAYVLNKAQTVGVSLIRNMNLEFLFDKGVLFAYRHGTKENGIFLQVFSLPFVIGVIAAIKRLSKNNFSHVYLILFTIVAGLPSALTSSTPYATRFLPIILGLSIIIALGIDILYNRVNSFLFEQSENKKTSRFIRLMASFSRRINIFIILAVAILLYQTALIGHIYFLHFPITSAPEFAPPTRELGLFIKGYEKSSPNTPVYFLNDRNCQAWGNDALHLWYFADLPSNEMITWNTAFRTKRYSDPKISPFDAYDKMAAPTATVSGVTLFPGYVDNASLPTGALRVYCGIHLGDTNPSQEKVLKVFYLYDDVQRNPYYFVTKKL